MATRVWTPAGGDNLFTNTANWSGAVVPTTGDDIIVPPTLYPIDCTGMASAVNRGFLHILKNCNKAIGTSGAKMLGDDFTYVRHEGSAGSKLWLNATVTAAATPWIAVVGQPGADLVDWTGTIPLAAVYGGRMTINSGATATTVLVGHKGSKNSDAVCIMEAGCTTLRQSGGSCFGNSGNVTTGEIGGGTFVRRGSGTMGTLSVNDALCHYEGTGTITLLYANPNSIVNLDDKLADDTGLGGGRSQALTVTASYRAPTAEIRGKSGLITYTAAIVDWRENAD